MKFLFFSKFLKLFNIFHKQKVQEPVVQTQVIQEPKIQEPQKKQNSLHFIFVTRCYKPFNISLIKDNLKEVFSKQNIHTYQQILVVDKKQNMGDFYFTDLIDQHTSVFFVENKGRDKYVSKGIDNALQNVNKEGYVYVLDDDNLISNKFLDICDDIDYQTDDVVFFKVAKKAWFYNPNLTDLIGKVDWSCYITKLSVMKQLKVFTTNINSVKCDGMFLDKVRRANKHIKVIDKEIGNYNVLPRPW